jgi:excinuclease ABC subunit A
MIKQTQDQIIDFIFSQFEQRKTTLLAPLVKGRKGHYRELFESIIKMGYTKVRIDGEIKDVVPKMQVDRYKIHDIEVVIDRLIPDHEDRYRLSQSVRTALKTGKGSMYVLDDQDVIHYLSQNLTDPESGISYEEPSPNSFSFNSPYGACQSCNGLGHVEEITEDSIIPDKSLSISRGGIAPLGEYRDLWIFKQIEIILKLHKVNISTPIEKIPEEAIETILYGSKEPLAVPSKKHPGTDWNTKFEGVITFLKRQQESDNDKIQ